MSIDVLTQSLVTLETSRAYAERRQAELQRYCRTLLARFHELQRSLPDLRDAQSLSRDSMIVALLEAHAAEVQELEKALCAVRSSTVQDAAELSADDLTSSQVQTSSASAIIPGALTINASAQCNLFSLEAIELRQCVATQTHPVVFSAEPNSAAAAQQRVPRLSLTALPGPSMPMSVPVVPSTRDRLEQLVWKHQGDQATRDTAKAAKDAADTERRLEELRASRIKDAAFNDLKLAELRAQVVALTAQLAAAQQRSGKCDVLPRRRLRDASTGTPQLQKCEASVQTLLMQSSIDGTGAQAAVDTTPATTPVSPPAATEDAPHHPLASQRALQALAELQEENRVLLRELIVAQGALKKAADEATAWEHKHIMLSSSIPHDATPSPRRHSSISLQRDDGVLCVSVRGLQDELVRVSAQRALDAQRLSESHHTVVALQHEAAVLQKRLDDANKSLADSNATAASLRCAVDALTSERCGLVRSVARLQQELREMETQRYCDRQSYGHVHAQLRESESHHRRREEELLRENEILASRLRVFHEAQQVHEYRESRNQVSAALYHDMRQQLEEYEEQESLLVQTLNRLLSTATSKRDSTCILDTDDGSADREVADDVVIQSVSELLITLSKKSRRKNAV